MASPIAETHWLTLFARALPATLMYLSTSS